MAERVAGPEDLIDLAGGQPTRAGHVLSSSVGLADKTDSELIDLVVDRNPDAYRALFDRHGASVSAAIRVVVGCSSRCDDIVADVFVAFWTAPEAFDPARSSLVGYLRLKAKSKSIDLVRREMARQRREALVSTLHRSLEGEIESSMLRAEMSVAVRQALSVLCDNEREPIVLAFFGGLTYKDTALKLGVPEGTVKSRIRSGLHHLHFDAELRQQLDLDTSDTETRP